MLEASRQFECVKCGSSFRLYADIEQYYAIPKPKACPSKGSKPCKGTNFRLVESASECRDYQEIKIQEHVYKLDMGSIPRSMAVVLENDLVDIVKPGDDVKINGIVKRRWRPAQAGERCDVEMFIHANSIEVSNEEQSAITVTEELQKSFEEHWKKYESKPIEGRNKILSSICPQVTGLFTTKLGMALLLIGGVPRVVNGMRIRGEIHYLLVGDPGTGKSQILKYASKLSTRSVLTTGIGTTSAGLTTTAVRDGNEWMLEAGALVLADGGVCCIDEFDSIREHDRTAIHEAMEQQTLSVAKAGLVCKLRCRTSVFAATNPKGKYDPTQSLTINTALASPLLSRFDIILILWDRENETWDRNVSSFILNKSSAETTEEKQTSFQDLWPFEKLQAYIAYVKAKFQPMLTAHAEEILKKYYQFQRQLNGHGGARTTIRMLESIVRIAQAHARLMFRNEVTITDAVVAVMLVESTNQNSLIIGPSSALHSPFPEYPMQDYLDLEAEVMNKLELDSIIDVKDPKIAEVRGRPNVDESDSQARLRRDDDTFHTFMSYCETRSKEIAEDNAPTNLLRTQPKGARPFAGTQPNGVTLSDLARDGFDVTDLFSQQDVHVGSKFVTEGRIRPNATSGDRDDPIEFSPSPPTTKKSLAQELLLKASKQPRKRLSEDPTDEVFDLFEDSPENRSTPSHKRGR
eukprot:TRINITY_DN1208_c0_g1_i5.p1 TRINITY_DN1208_c0_g1~~TRINITY_DN1208_c0_g1_i5.p1  ORF type:complete len:690 (+),score=132.60 TRINITY_DN1208_c0_g1_i5:677-2746(+)